MKFRLISLVYLSFILSSFQSQASHQLARARHRFVQAGTRALTAEQRRNFSGWSCYQTAPDRRQFSRRLNEALQNAPQRNHLQMPGWAFVSAIVNKHEDIDETQASKSFFVTPTLSNTKAWSMSMDKL